MRGLMKTRKAITPFVILTFLFMVMAISEPIGATDNVKVSVSSEEGQPGAVEAPQTYAKKKSSPIIPIVIGLVLVGGIAAVLYFVVLKNKYDITGMWTVNFRWSTSGSSGTTTLTFTGDKKSGTFQSSYGSTGTYVVDKKNVAWTYSVGTVYSGTFIDKNNMSGTMIDYNGYPGTWTAVKMGATSVIPVPQSKPDRDDSGQKIK